MEHTAIIQIMHTSNKHRILFSLKNRSKNENEFVTHLTYVSKINKFYKGKKCTYTLKTSNIGDSHQLTY